MSKLFKNKIALLPDQVLDGGYPQTKWVAEKLVKIAGDRGLPISIYRPGRISWHSKTGVCNPEDHTSRMIKGCIQLGIAPDLDALINLAPVDYVSQAIVHLSKQPSSGRTFHIVNRHLAYWQQFVNDIRSFVIQFSQLPRCNGEKNCFKLLKVLQKMLYIPLCRY
jgi:thioester reductase-like protein